MSCFTIMIASSLCVARFAEIAVAYSISWFIGLVVSAVFALWTHKHFAAISKDRRVFATIILWWLVSTLLMSVWWSTKYAI